MHLVLFFVSVTFLTLLFLFYLCFSCSGSAVHILHCSDPSTLSVQMYAEYVALHTLSGILTCCFYQENHADHSIEVLCMMEEVLFVNRPCLNNTVHSIEQPSFSLFHPLSVSVSSLVPTLPSSLPKCCYVIFTGKTYERSSSSK